MNFNHILVNNKEVVNDSIKFKFNSTLNINKILIKPFGSSRMRYENKDVLNFNLKLLKKDIDTNSYVVTISKNHDQIKKSKNACFFYNNKFDIVLELWFPIFYRKLNTKIIRSLLPVDYGDIIFNNIKYPDKKYKFGIVIPFFSRHNYVDKFLTSLKLTNLNDCLIVFIDESLTKDVNEDKRKVNKMIQNFDIKYPLIKIYKKNHGNMFDSILYGFDLLYSYCDFLCTIDSDTIHKKEWIQDIYIAYNKCKKDFPDSNILVSGFNVVNERHSIIEKNKNYILKNSIGGCNMFFSKNIYTNIVRKCLFSHKWDTNIVNYLKEFDSKIITTNPSVIQHIGFETSIEGRKDKDKYDYAEDFIMNNLIILTTSIVRGNLHKETIGKFYNTLYKNLKNFNIYHIINIDCPLKLKNIFNVIDTKKLFDKIIPDEVNKIYLIDDKLPGFGKAYKKVIQAVYSHNLLNQNSLIWWLEDDWDIINNYNIYNILHYTLQINSGYNAINFTSNTPLCSFRGGPIMNYNFFKTYFDITKNYDTNSDPEYKVGKSIRYNRVIDKYNNIYITCIFISSLIKPPYSLNSSCILWYKKKFGNTKFNKFCGFKYIIAVLENPESSIIKYKISNDPYEHKINKISDLDNLDSINFNLFLNLFQNSSLNYFNVVPHIFKDVGRVFNKKYNLLK